MTQSNLAVDRRAAEKPRNKGFMIGRILVALAAGMLIAGSWQSTAFAQDLFEWNSCYTGANSTHDYGSFCLEQWGSFPSNCSEVGDEQYAGGKKCSENINVGDCNPGAFTDYSTGMSWDMLASAYYCVPDTAAIAEAEAREAAVAFLDNAAPDYASLTTDFDTYLQAVDNGGGTVTASSTNRGPWERFYLSVWEGNDYLPDGDTCILDGDTITIVTMDGYYFSAQDNGGLDSNRSAGGPWERFVVINHTDSAGCLASGDVISLYNPSHEKYMVGDDLGDAYVNRTEIGPWEKFTVTLD